MLLCCTSAAATSGGMFVRTCQRYPTQGVLLGLALLLGGWDDARSRALSAWAQRAWYLAAPAGLLLYMVFLHARFNDAFAFLHVQAVGRGT